MAGEFYLTNLSGSLDWGYMIDQIMQVKSIPIQRLQQEKSLVQAKLSAIGNLKRSISDFASLFENLNVDELFQGKKASVSDTSVINVSVNNDAPNIEFSVTVNKLSQAEIRVSNGGVTDLTTGFASSGTLTINYNTGSGTQTFSINYSAGQTLEDLVNAINSAQDKVKASVYYDGTTYRLMLSEADVGASTVETDTVAGVYAIEVSGLPSELGTGLDTIQGAQNAEIVIGSGSPVISPSNTFENVISGVTIEAKSTGTANVTISESYSSVTSFLNDFVKRYNDLNDTVKALTRSEQSPFRGDYTISKIGSDIANMLDPLIELGVIDYDGENGQISLDTAKLNQILQEDPQKVRDVIESLASSYSSYLKAQQDVFDAFEKNYNEKIERIDQRIEILAKDLARQEELLRQEFAQLESFIARANDIRERLKQFMVSISEATKSG